MQPLPRLRGFCDTVFSSEVIELPNERNEILSEEESFDLNAVDRRREEERMAREVEGRLQHTATRHADPDFIREEAGNNGEDEELDDN